MNKQELLQDLEGKGFVDGITSDPVKYDDPKSIADNFYSVVVREINGNVATFTDAYFVVIDEGKPTERAFYVREEPTDIVLKVKI